MNDTPNIQVGDEVGWQWLNGVAMGVVLEVHPTRHEIISKGAHVVRNGTPEDPAVVIRHTKGALVLKLAHELQRLH